MTADLKDKYDDDKNIFAKVTMEDIREFGMIPEFIGRSADCIYIWRLLDEDMLVKDAYKSRRNAILKQYQKLLPHG